MRPLSTGRISRGDAPAENLDCERLFLVIGAVYSDFIDVPRRRRINLPPSVPPLVGGIRAFHAWREAIPSFISIGAVKVSEIGGHSLGFTKRMRGHEYVTRSLISVKPLVHTNGFEQPLIFGPSRG